MLILQNISKRYKEKIVLQNINLSFLVPKIVAIIGENGCGKSTLFKIILDLAKPNCGIVKFTEKEDTVKNRQKYFANGIVETPCFFINLTGYENIKAFLTNNINSEILNKIAIDFGIKEYLEMPVKKYSLGMKQKLAILIILLSNADILLFDEPTNALDQNALMTFKKYMHEEKQNGKLILIASHDYKFLNSFVDEIYEFKCGNLEKNNKNSISRTIYLFSLTDKNGAISELKNNGCYYELLDDDNIAITNWYLPLIELVSLLLPFGIKKFICDEKEITDEE